MSVSQPSPVVAYACPSNAAKRNSDALGNPDSIKIAIVERYEAMCNALHACKLGTVVGAEDYEPPSPEEMKRQKMPSPTGGAARGTLATEFCVCASLGAGTMSRGINANYDQDGNKRSASTRKAMLRGGGKKKN